MEYNFSDLITFAIPTYNRCLTLCEGLIDLLAKVGRFQVNIIVVDNCSTDDTRAITEAFIKRYEHLTYYCQESNKGYDHNFETALRLSKTPYTWVLGDGTRLVEEHLLPIFTTLEKEKPDAYIVDNYHRAGVIPSQTFTSANPLLRTLGWHLTLLSATIYSRKIIDNASFSKYRNTHFIHFGILFDFFANEKEIKVLWNREDIIRTTQIDKGNSWNPYRVMEIFGKAWTEVVMSLPDQLTLDAKKECIRQHGKQTGLFSFKHLLKQRAVRGLDYSIYKEYKSYIPLFAPGATLRIAIASIWPDTLNHYYKRFKKKGMLKAERN